MTAIYGQCDLSAELDKIRQKINDDAHMHAIIKTVNDVQKACDQFMPLASTSSVSPRLGGVYYSSTTRML